MLIPLAPRILNVDCRRNGFQFADSVDWIRFRVCRGLLLEIRDFEPQASLPRSGPQLTAASDRQPGSPRATVFMNINDAEIHPMRKIGYSDSKE